MKTIARYMTLVMFLTVVCYTAGAQTAKSKSKTTTTTTTAKKPAPAPAKDMQVTLKSLCERNLAIYSGPKAGLRDPHIKQIGGLSKTTLHVRTWDVVCIIGEKNKIVACAEVKPQTALIEVGSSGTTINAK